jgi:hypothetical protein
VNFWEAKGKCVQSKVVPCEQDLAVEDDIANELKVLRAGDNADWFVSGANSEYSGSFAGALDLR